ncbi:MAG: hypothetical protein FWG25_01165 [Promicromonosporaceae bacterium]|nr:hypothetical protein [Promicromonosporaceae bacterium]
MKTHPYAAESRDNYWSDTMRQAGLVIDQDPSLLLSNNTDDDGAIAA